MGFIFHRRPVWLTRFTRGPGIFCGELVIRRGHVAGCPTAAPRGGQHLDGTGGRYQPITRTENSAGELVKAAPAERLADDHNLRA